MVWSERCKGKTYMYIISCMTLVFVPCAHKSTEPSFHFSLFLCLIFWGILVHFMPFKNLSLLCKGKCGLRPLPSIMQQMKERTWAQPEWRLRKLEPPPQSEVQSPLNLPPPHEKTPCIGIYGESPFWVLVSPLPPYHPLKSDYANGKKTMTTKLGINSVQ